MQKSHVPTHRGTSDDLPTPLWMAMDRAKRPKLVSWVRTEGPHHDLQKAMTRMAFTIFVMPRHSLGFFPHGEKTKVLFLDSCGYFGQPIFANTYIHICLTFHIPGPARTHSHTHIHTHVFTSSYIYSSILFKPSALDWFELSVASMSLPQSQNNNE